MDKTILINHIFSFRGKSIIFVNTVDRCYKLKLFLEQFGIPTCVLNSELPATSRCRAVSQFNNGIYDIIIASDEKALEEVRPCTFFCLFNKIPIICIIIFTTAAYDQNEKEQTKKRQRIGRSARH